MILYYQDKQGDYMACDHDTKSYYRRYGRDEVESRATAIMNEVGSVCTCGVSLAWLHKNAKRVARKDVPQEWVDAIGYHAQPEYIP